jgi:hypothetical protein
MDSAVLLIKTHTHKKEFYMSTFTHAGVSRLNGEMKVRFCNDALRVKVLAKNGHKDIDIVELKTPMSKEDAVAFLLSIDFATQNGKTNADVQSALEQALDKRSPKAEKAAPKVKAKAKPTMEGIKAKVAAKKTAVPKAVVTKAEVSKMLAEAEDAPY